jgi:hypothetical protein
MYIHVYVRWEEKATREGRWWRVNVVPEDQQGAGDRHAARKKQRDVREAYFLPCRAAVGDHEGSAREEPG